jgi:hypothetical protein
MRHRTWFRLFSFALLPGLYVPGVVAQPGGRQVVHGSLPSAITSARVAGRMAPESLLDLAVGLPLRNPEVLDAFLEQLSDPASPNYHAFLTPEAFTARFGPSEEVYQSLIQFLQANNLTVTGLHSNRTIVDVRGAVTDIEKTLHVHMLRYQHPVRGLFFAPDRDPSVDFDGPIVSISGLDNFVEPHPMDLKTAPLEQQRPLVTGSGPGGLFIGKDFRAAYAPNVTLTGAGQTIGLFELDGFYASDVQANFQAAGQTPVPVQTVLLDGFSGTPQGSQIEVTLDIMMASYMAPGASKIIVYEGTNPNDVLNRMANDNLASELSCSWGFWPISASTEQIFKQMIAQGQSFFQASGDGGAYTGPIMPPSDDPNVTVVGGTSLTTAGAGGPWQSETAWSGSGGGISTTYPIPSYQQKINMGANGGSTTMRNIPDVALTADIQMFLIVDGEGFSVGGTSAATPLWAGFTALVNQQATAQGGQPIGFVNPLLYTLGEEPDYTTDLHDITTGNDSGFSAVAGYDLVTGWGTPAGQGLINDLTGMSNQPSFSLSAAPASVSVKPGATATAKITVSPLNGFSGSVALSASGLPSGVTASFSPSSTTATSTLTLTASSSALGGTSSVTVTGASGSVKNTLTLSVTVQAPSFALSAPAATLSVAQGANATATIEVTGANGFSSSVALSASGLPSGVTAAFSPASTSGKSTLTLTAGALAAVGSATVTITGASGDLKSTATIALTVTPAPTFSLSVSPASVSLYQGMSGTTLITVTAQNGFSGTVSLSASSLPTGVTASFGTPAADTILMTLTAKSTTAAGNSTITITGKSGSLSRTASLALTVLASSANSVLVNPGAAYNIPGMVTDGSVFTNGGLDGGGRSYSANLLGSAQTVGGTPFYLGPANTADAVSSKAITLPAGQYSAIKLLATAVNGNQPAQNFTVTYTDGSTSVFTQGLSDWFTPQNYPGETTAVSMNYRDNSDGTRDGEPFYLYSYSFNLSSSKTVSSISLPNNRNVVVLAVSLVKAAPAAVRR